MAYRSITLAPKETYVLPAGAQIVSATDPNLITSLNDCANLDNLEALECYVIPLVATDADSLDSQSAWMYEAPTKIIGLYVAGVKYVLNIGMTPDGAFFVEQVEAFIEANSTLNGILIEVTSSRDDSATRGGIATLCFKTLPSIATDMYIEVQTNLLDPGGYTILRGYPIPYADFTYSGDGMCACTSPD
jgi:hypothetical protein